MIIYVCIYYFYFLQKIISIYYNFNKLNFLKLINQFIGTQFIHNINMIKIPKLKTFHEIYSFHRKKKLKL